MSKKIEKCFRPLGGDKLQIFGNFIPFGSKLTSLKYFESISVLNSRKIHRGKWHAYP